MFDRNVIDSHLHIKEWFGEDGESYFDGFDRYQRKYGFKAINLCAVPVHYGDVSNNIMAALYKLHNPTAFAYGGMVYNEFPAKTPQPSEMASEIQYKELMEIGFDGIKIIESKPLDNKRVGLPLNHEFYEGLFRSAEADKTHIIWHVADPEEFWDKEKAPEWVYTRGYFYGNGDFVSDKELYSQVFDVLKRHPKLVATFAHFFFWSNYPEKLEKLFSDYKNVSIDLVPGSEMYTGIDKKHDYYRDFFNRFQDRITYGTDITFPEAPQNWDMLALGVKDFLTTDKTVKIFGATAKGLKLDDSVSNKILCSNFTKFCGEKPKEINVGALKAYVKKYEHLIEDDNVKQLIKQYLSL